MKSFVFALLFSCLSLLTFAQQKSYADSLKSWQEKYIKEHGAVKGADRKHLQFYPVDEKYKVTARVERIYEAPWFNMETSGKEKKAHRVYAILHFQLSGKSYKLEVYQSQKLMDVKEYANYLFIPFTDLTNGEESYENGRYIDLLTDELENGSCVIDLNKAYNPYCAYISNVYNCPIPPKENDLSVAIKAGEKKFGKLH